MSKLTCNRSIKPLQLNNVSYMVIGFAYTYVADVNVTDTLIDQLSTFR